MSTQQECLPPVTIGGINITPDLLRALDSLREDSIDMSFFTEQCLILASMDLENYGIEKRLFLILLDMFNVLKSLNEDKEGGAQ